MLIWPQTVIIWYQTGNTGNVIKDRAKPNRPHATPRTNQNAPKTDVLRKLPHTVMLILRQWPQKCWIPDIWRPRIISVVMKNVYICPATGNQW